MTFLLRINQCQNCCSGGSEPIIQTQFGFSILIYSQIKSTFLDVNTPDPQERFSWCAINPWKLFMYLVVTGKLAFLKNFVGLDTSLVYGNNETTKMWEWK